MTKFFAYIKNMALKRLRYGSKKVFRKKARSTPRLRTRPARHPLQRTTLGTTFGFPKMLKFKHKYASQIDLSPGASMSHYLFRANGMYDPDYTGTGHQPMYFDQMSALYNHYTVIGSKIKYTVVPAGTTVQVPYKVITWINDDAATVGNIDALAENKFAKQRICGGGINPTKVVVTNTWSAKKFFGGSIMANDQLQGSNGADPTEVSYFQLTIRSIDGVSTVNVHVIVEIEYVAVWKELKELSTS